MKKSLLVLISASSLCLLAACGSGSPPPATHFSVTAPATATAGTTVGFTVTALDASNRATTNYSGTAHVTSTDGQATLPANAVLTNGTGNFSATLKTAGSQTITATDTVTASITGTSTSVTVSPGPTSLFSVTTAASPTAGTSFSFTVTAFDAFNNTATSYSGTVKFTSTDTQAALPPPSKLTNGTMTFQTTLKTSGNQMITATDTVMASITGSLSIAISAGPVTHLSVSAPPNAVADDAFDVTVSALDAFDNIATSYSGTIQFKSTDQHADLPPVSTLPNGFGPFPVGLKSVGGQTITATDTVTPALMATTNLINVSAATAANPVPLINQPLSPDAILPGGASFILTVNGTGFVSGSVVNWNGHALATQFVSQSKLTATVLAGDVASFNTAAVTVFNPAPEGGTSNVVYFQTTRTTSAVAMNGPSSLATSSGAYYVATGDFNGNGKLDLAVADNSSAGGVGIYLGNGDGTFQATVNYLTGPNSSSVAVGDFNGDGKLDLAVANVGTVGVSPGTVSILLGNGDGTFQPAVNYSAGQGATSVAVGDFNGDGKLDLAVANVGTAGVSPGTVSILLGNGDGTFQPALDYDASTVSGSVVVADFNNDGKLDLAVANATGEIVSILLGNGDGTFQPAVNYSAGQGATSVAVGDFNGDGKLDLAVANVGTAGVSPGTVSILLGNGDGTFQPAVNYSAGQGATSVAVGDFNGDNKLDLVVIGSSSSGVSLLLGNGDGTFQPAANFDLPGNPASVAVGDFDASGRFGIAAVGSASSSVLLQPLLVSGPNAILSGTNLIFPAEIVGNTSPEQSVRLINYGTDPLDISSIAPSSNFAETNNCGSALAAGAACTINANFTPGVAGNLNGTLSINDNAPGSPQMVALSGIGARATTATLTPSTMEFVCGYRQSPMWSCSSPEMATLTNTGTSTMYIQAITIPPETPFSQTNNCPTSLLVGQSCAITVSFYVRPPRTTGTVNYTSTLSVNDTATGSPQQASLEGAAQ